MKKAFKTTEEAYNYMLDTGFPVYDKNNHKYEINNNGLICKTIDGYITIGAKMSGFNIFYRENDQLEINIEEGKFYQNRNGDKVICTFNSGYYCKFNYIGKNCDGYWTINNGRADEDSKNSLDIIKKWE